MHDIILKTLEQNMGYSEGERVLVVKSVSPQDGLARFERSADVSDAIVGVLRAADVDVDLLEVQHMAPRNGANPTQQAFDAIADEDYAIAFMPTAFSFTHTAFRKALTDTGCRVASMPGFKLEFFEKGGPLDVDYDEVLQRTERVASDLREATHVRIQADGTDIRAAIDHDNIHTSTGLITEPGSYGNLPGAETFFPPLRDTSGTVTIPAGWGGPQPLPFPVTLRIEDGRFVEATGEDDDWVDENVKNVLFGGDGYDVVAEIGIGTNHGLTAASIERYGFDILLAEKIWNTAHIANGNSAAMGGDNDVPVHVDWVFPDVRITYG